MSSSTIFCTSARFSASYIITLPIIFLSALGDSTDSGVNMAPATSVNEISDLAMCTSHRESLLKCALILFVGRIDHKSVANVACCVRHGSEDVNSFEFDRSYESRETSCHCQHSNAVPQINLNDPSFRGTAMSDSDLIDLMGSSPPGSPRSSSELISHDAIAEAVEHRIHQEMPLARPAQVAAEHDKRQAFRRLVDPGILRPNSHETAMVSLKTLLTIAENLLREPSNPKFQRFKATNSSIKRHLMDPKGALEYAIALGFRPKVVDFQPLYVFNPRNMPALRMGAAILKDFIDLENEKLERAKKSRMEEKAAVEAAANKVKLAFFDDRKTKAMHDEREKQRREVLATRGTVETHHDDSMDLADSPASDNEPE